MLSVLPLATSILNLSLLLAVGLGLLVQLLGLFVRFAIHLLRVVIGYTYACLSIHVHLSISIYLSIVIYLSIYLDFMISCLLPSCLLLVRSFAVYSSFLLFAYPPAPCSRSTARINGLSICSVVDSAPCSQLNILISSSVSLSSSAYRKQ